LDSLRELRSASRASSTASAWTGRVAGDPTLALTAALGSPAILAAVVTSQWGEVGAAVAATAAAVALQFSVRAANRWHHTLHRRQVLLVHLGVALLLAAVLIELVIPASFALYVPVVGMAAALGAREGVVIGGAAVLLYLVPVAMRGDQTPELLARGVAGATVCLLVAVGARYFVGQRERATAELRIANARERRRARQLAGIEAVGRLLAAGPTSDVMAQVMDVLVDRFGYRYVSIYLARSDDLVELGAQRGYATTIETFDGTYGVVGRVMRNRRAELVTDVSTDPDYTAANPNVVSEIAAPLMVGDEFLGVVNVESARRTLDETDFRTVVAVADRLAAYVALGRERQWLAELAIRDPLTGLHNRRYLDDSLTRQFAARARQQPEDREPVSAILFDLDHFGNLNKQHGLAVGDDTLRQVGQILSHRFRLADLVARYGGEEFLVVLTGASLGDTEARANLVRLEICNGSPESGSPALPVTISAGCASLPAADVGSASQLLAAADVALNMAKRAGRNRVVSAGT
jgi:diguanylate cyclase (GGDEF)-like protein